MNTTTPHAAPAAAPAESRHRIPPPAPGGEVLTPHLEEVLSATERRKLALEPNDQEAVWWLCEQLAELKIYGVKSPQDALARIMVGRPLGLTAMQSVDGIRLLWQKKEETYTSVMFVKHKLALVYGRPDVVEYVRPVELTATKATWVGKRRGQPEVPYTFTIDDAVTAGLLDRGESRDDKGRSMNNYDRHPKAMLQWRACGRLLDIIAPDVLLGIASYEDLADENRIQEALQQAADEILARLPIQSLEEKLAATPAPAGRDFAKEALELKTQIGEAIASKDPNAKKRVKEAFDAFSKVAPQDLVAEVHAFYNVARGAKSKDKPPAADDPKPEPAAGQPAPGQPAAKPGETASAPGDLPVKPLPACIACGEPVPGSAGTWVPAKNGWVHKTCEPPARQPGEEG